MTPKNFVQKPLQITLPVIKLSLPGRGDIRREMKPKDGNSKYRVSMSLAALNCNNGERDRLTVNYTLPCILRNLLGRRGPLPSSIYACQSKRCLVRGGPSYPPMPAPCCRSGQDRRLSRRRRAGDSLRGERGLMWDSTTLSGTSPPSA